MAFSIPDVNALNKQICIEKCYGTTKFTTFVTTHHVISCNKSCVNSCYPKIASNEYLSDV